MIELLLLYAMTLAEHVEENPAQIDLELASLTAEERRRAHVMTSALSLLGTAAIRLCSKTTEPLQVMDTLINGLSSARSAMAKRRDARRPQGPAS